MRTRRFSHLRERAAHVRERTGDGMGPTLFARDGEDALGGRERGAGIAQAGKDASDGKLGVERELALPRSSREACGLGEAVVGNARFASLVCQQRVHVLQQALGRDRGRHGTDRFDFRARGLAIARQAREQAGRTRDTRAGGIPCARIGIQRRGAGGTLRRPVAAGLRDA